MAHEWVNTAEAERRTGISSSSIYNAAKKGRLAHKVADKENVILIRMDRLLEAIADGRIKKGKPRTKSVFASTPMQQAALLTLGWVYAQHGVNADPVRWLAHTLTVAGVKCSHLDDINAQLAKSSKNGN